MEESHLSQLRDRFRHELSDVDVWILDIPDDYGFMDSELVTLIEAAMEEVLAA